MKYLKGAFLILFLLAISIRMVDVDNKRTQHITNCETKYSKTIYVFPSARHIITCKHYDGNK